MPLPMALRMAPHDRADRCPMALYSTFSACLSGYIRGKRNSLSPFRGRAVLDGAVGRLLASVAGRVREPDGLPAGRAGAVRGAAGQHVARAAGASLSCLIADRAHDRDAGRAGRGPRDVEAVLPARRRRANAQPRDPERYPARRAGHGISGWLPRGRYAATGYDPYAHRCLDFPYLAAAWIRLSSNGNATWGMACWPRRLCGQGDAQGAIETWLPVRIIGPSRAAGNPVSG